MYSIQLFRHFFYDDIKFFLVNSTTFLVKGKFGKVIIRLADYSFVSQSLSDISFLFVNKLLYSNFVKYMYGIYSSINKIFFFRLRLKGLGYRMVRMNIHIFRFFFAKNHFYYFYLPYSIYIKIRRRNFFVLSFNKAALNDLFHHFMLLKKLDLYEKSNSFVSKNKILFLKKRK